MFHLPPASVLTALFTSLSGGDALPTRPTATPIAPPPLVQDGGVDVSVGPKGFWVKSADGSWSIKVGGRLQADLNLHVDEDSSLDPITNDGTELRRARFELKGTVADDMRWAAELDMANNGVSIKDFWVGQRYGGDGPTYYVGHQKQPYSLDVEMSSNDIPFVERGVDTFLVIPFVDRAIGVRVQDTCGDNTFYAAGLFGESVSPNSVEDEGWGLAGRLIHAPIIDEDQVVHLGARAAFRAPDDGTDSIRIRDETTNMSNLRVVDTGTITDVDLVSIYGAEAYWANGPWSVGGEYNMMSVDRDGGDFDFSSYHVQAAYSLTGESFASAYRIGAGEFKRLRPGEDGGRPWEVAARLASIDLNDSGLSGGEEDVVSVGVNWYYSGNLRLMWNWSNIISTDGGGATTDDAEGTSIFTFRTQFTF